MSIFERPPAVPEPSPRRETTMGPAVLLLPETRETQVADAAVRDLPASAAPAPARDLQPARDSPPAPAPAPAPTAPAPAPTAPAPATINNMLVRQPVGNPQLSLAKMSAVDFVFAYPHGAPSSISKQDKARATQTYKWFMLMATSEEATALKAATRTGPEGNSGNKRVILKRLNNMILDLLRNAFDAHPTASMPSSLKKNSLLGMNYIADRLRQLKMQTPETVSKKLDPTSKISARTGLEREVPPPSGPPAHLPPNDCASLLLPLLEPAPVSRNAVPRKHRLRQL